MSDEMFNPEIYSNKDITEDLGYEITDYSVDGLCPQCGLDIYEAHTGGACNEIRQYCPGEDCGWTSNPLYDC